MLLNFLDAWGAITGQLFPTGQRIDIIDGLQVTWIDAAMPLMILRASDLGLSGRERPAELDAHAGQLERIEKLRLEAGRRMGLGDVSDSVVPKPVPVSAGDGTNNITSRYFTPHKCHASHAVTGAIGVATAFSLPGAFASGMDREPGAHALVVLHPAGQIDTEVEIKGLGEQATVKRAALVRTVRKIMQGLLHLPGYVFPSTDTGMPEGAGQVGGHTFPRREIHLIVPTSAGGGNDTMARAWPERSAPCSANRWRSTTGPGRTDPSPANMSPPRSPMRTRCSSALSLPTASIQRCRNCATTRWPTLRRSA